MMATTSAAGAGDASGAPSSSGTDIWSEILDSVKGARGVPTKNLFILGGPQTGKSTLVSRINSRTGQAPVQEGEGGGLLDLGLSYSLQEVGDEADEETLARVGVHQVPSSAAPYAELLALALERTTLQGSVVVITLDWEKPWLFLKELGNWIALLEGVLAKSGVLDKFEGSEAKERIEAQWRSYTEPPAPGAPASVAHLADSDTPLAPGTLTDNLGLPIVVVCTKADVINALEREKDFKEEQFDYVQQTLRTLALRYGASLFFTSHARPESFANLRSYLLHRLFTTPAPFATANTAVTPAAPNGVTIAGPTSTAPVVSATASRSFGFNLKANSVDRDQILIPSGWDSWGKIKVLRDRFDPDGLGKGWEVDLAAARDLAAGREPDAEGVAVDEEGRRVVSCVRQYGEMIVDLDADEGPAQPSNEVEAQDEQTFFKLHAENIQKERDRAGAADEQRKDPKAAFQPRMSMSAASGVNGSDPVGLGFAPSVVGPMGSAGLHLLTGALDGVQEEGSAGPRHAARTHRRESSLGGRSAMSPSMSPPLGSSNTTSPALSSSLLSPTASAGAAAATAPGASNEILSQFFQGLLASRSSGAPGAPPAAGGASSRVGGVQGLSPVLTQSMSRTASTQSAASSQASPTVPPPS